ncbi:PQQ-binding-like beta-propeller repeat protein, partial [Streptomyces sp. x-19]|uniref:outer membrane protein assembly factor BamB family protein n=1 Tax=Streptomyces sp. x-19 TaxID=2789280 RepID=UPI0039807300
KGTGRYIKTPEGSRVHQRGDPVSACGEAIEPPTGSFAFPPSHSQTGAKQSSGLKTFSPHQPVIGDQAVFVPTVPDRLRALHLPNFRPRWDIRLRVDPAMMAFVEGVLYAPGQSGGLYAIDPRTGTHHRSVLLPGHPILARVRIASDSLIVLAGPPLNRGSGAPSTKGCVLAVDPSDGRERRVYEAQGSLLPHWTASGQTLYLLEEIKTVQYLVAVDLAGGQVSGRWKLADAAACPPVASSSASHILDQSGVVRTYSSAYPHHRWTHETQQRTPVPPVVAKDLVLVAGAPQLLLALEAATGTERWRCEERGEFTTPPILVEDTVYVAHRGGRLLALDLATGDRVGSMPCPGWVEGERGRPVVANGKLVFAGRYGGVHAIDLGLG